VRDWRPDRLFWAAVASAAVAVVGFVTRVPVLAGAGVAGVLGAALVFEWQRRALSGVSYQRHLARHRALFGEEVPLTVTVENAKALPLTWLRIEDTVSSPLTVRGGILATAAQTGRRPELVTLMSVLPYQRVERPMVVVCDRRGPHTFGPARIESGDPFGYRSHVARAADPEELVVLPKTFGLAPQALVSRLALGPARSRALVTDPSRVAGSREFQAGDPLRHLDWRGTARRGQPMVRVFEPTATPRVVLVLDTRWRVTAGEEEQFEFAVALVASLVIEVAARKVGVGLLATGSVDGRPAALAPSTAPDAPGILLDALARLSPYGRRDPGALAAAVDRAAGPGCSLVVVAGRLRPDMAVGLAAARRRGVPVAGIEVAGPGVAGPGAPGWGEAAAQILDERYRVIVPEDWRHRDHVELVG
jgi:uncharacterized protein (DUF58 family)